MSLNKSLRRIRQAAGLSQRQLAERLGKSRVMVTRVESEARGTTFEQLQAWAAACGHRVELTPTALSEALDEAAEAGVSLEQVSTIVRALAHLTPREVRVWTYEAELAVSDSNAE